MIRLASEADAAPIAAIYAPCVRSTPISFEVVAPSPAEMAERIVNTLPRYPWLVEERDGAVAGYAYAGPYAQRVCYRWSVTTSVYVRDDYRHQGIGRRLYRALLALLAEQGFRSAYAGITLPNAGSVGLHEALGFRKVAHFAEGGMKFGRWVDVGYWELNLARDGKG